MNLEFDSRTVGDPLAGATTWPAPYARKPEWRLNAYRSFPITDGISDANPWRGRNFGKNPTLIYPKPEFDPSKGSEKTVFEASIHVRRNHLLTNS